MDIANYTYNKLNFAVPEIPYNRVFTVLKIVTYLHCKASSATFSEILDVNKYGVLF